MFCILTQFLVLCACSQCEIFKRVDLFEHFDRSICVVTAFEFSSKCGLTSRDCIMNHLANSPELDGYSKKVRVNFHEVTSDIGTNNLANSVVKFSSEHKKHPGLKAILSMSMGKSNRADHRSPVITIESLQLLDYKRGISNLSDQDLEQILYSVLLATFEYGNNHKINEWLIAVNPAFRRQLDKMDVSHNPYSVDDKGRCVIGVNPSEFISKGKQLINLWTRHFFEGGPLLN